MKYGFFKNKMASEKFHNKTQWTQTKKQIKTRSINGTTILQTGNLVSSILIQKTSGYFRPNV